MVYFRQQRSITTLQTDGQTDRETDRESADMALMNTYISKELNINA